MDDSFAFASNMLLRRMADGMMARKLPAGLDAEARLVGVKFALAAGIADQNFAHVLDRGVFEMEHARFAAALDKSDNRVL